MAAQEGGWLIQVRKIAIKKSQLISDIHELFNCLFGIYCYIYNKIVEQDAQNHYSLSDMTTVCTLLTKKENFMADKLRQLLWRDVMGEITLQGAGK